MITELIGSNIKSFREDNNWSQKDLAEKLSVARPTISNWESGKAEPSSSQLTRLSKEFGVSADMILGISSTSKRVVVVDTSALIKRPALLSELNGSFDQVIVPDIVISELNNLKDSKKKPAIKQKAWLVMSWINNEKTSITISKNEKATGNADEKIADVAIRCARAKPHDEIFVLSDDIYFQFLVESYNSITAITPADYSRDFTNVDTTKYDHLRSIEFFEAVYNKELKVVKSLYSREIDINFYDPDTGLTPLIGAVRRRKYDVIEYLLGLPNLHVDSLDKHKYFFSAVHHATQLKDMKSIRLLTEGGADIGIGSQGKNAGNTPLMVSAWSGFTDGVNYFLEHGACANQQDANGYTALTKACIKNHELIINILADVTDTNIRSKENKVARDYLNPKKLKPSQISKLFEVQSD